ncbi:uncharacterized protein ISCGN_016618 [Ixodes scapularis]
MEMDETAADGEKRIGGIPERGWNYIIRKKDKKVSSSTSDVKSNMGSTEEQKPKRRRFGPMPGDEIKITVRPEKGLKLGDTREGSVGKALIKAIRRNHALRDEEITTRILKGTNAIIVSTKREDIAKAVTEIEELEIEGKKHSFKAKVIMEDTVKGVVYRVSKEFTDEELGENFSVRGKYADIEIIEARRIRDTEVVVLTFSGDRLPNQVCLYGQMAHVWEYRPVKQVCFVCMKPGHRSDVCPTPDAKGCRNCGRTHAEGEENCRARCAFCEGEHPTGDKECKKRYKEPTKKVQPKTTDTLTDVSKKKAWAEAQSNIEDFPTLRWVTGQANYPTIEGEKSDKQKISEMEETIRELKKVAEIQREQFQRTMEIQREQFHKMEEQNAKMAETIKRLEGNSWRQEEKHKKELETLRRRCENKTDEPKTQPKPAEAPKKAPKERKGPLEERKEQLDNKFENKFELLESKFEQLENKFEQRFAKIEQMLASLLDGAAGPPRRKCAKDGYESDVSCDEVEKPHLILLQEPNSEANLSGYYVYGNDKNKPRVATLVNKNITVIHHETKQEVENVLTEVVPSNKGGKSTFVLNVYAQHKGYKTEDLAEIMETACKMAGKDNAIVVAGDFNSAHTEWGYVKDTKRGKELLKLIEMHELTIINDTDCHTRVGNSGSRDTNPDLSMIRGATAGWINTQETLGSDHCIIRIEVVADAKRRRIGKNQRTDWRKFRQEVETRPIDDLARWTRELKRAKEDYTNEVELTEKVTAVDSRLETLWKKRRNLTVKWKINKLNRNLRRRVAELNEEIEKYADDLARQNWWQKCDKLQNTLETKQTWNLLKYLADPASTRGETNRTLTRIVHKFQGDVLEYIKNRYVPDQGTPETGNEYTGRTNESLDRDFDVGELVAAAAETTNSTPGRDGITNATLRNLPQKTQKQLTNFINEVWNSGKVPEEWKHSQIKLIPKQGKKPHIDNMRPISLTSNVGKLMERMVKNRLQRYLEEEGLMPHCMYGFRPHLSTQDVLLQIREEVLSGKIPAKGEHIVLAIDLKAAFDNVAHSAILDNLNATNGGEKTYNYVRSFLENRSATIQIDDTKTKTFDMPNKGTPQGAVLSPLLFNIALFKLSERLAKIPNIEYAVYADDITIWITKGSLGEKEERLQKAAEVIQEVAKASGLHCSPEKSEILRIHGRRYDRSIPINVTIEGHTVPEVKELRLLGMWLQHNGKATLQWEKISKTIDIMGRMIKRVTHRKWGLKERDVAKIVQAVVVSRITYCMPYHRITKTEERKIDCKMRGVYKLALGLPITTSTEKLMAMGISNTYGEHKDAMLTAQKERLGRSETGRRLATKLGFNDVRTKATRTADLSDMAKNTYIVRPIPKHMRPDTHEQRRLARARYYERIAKKGEVAYVDAADYPDRDAKVAVYLDKNKMEKNSCSMPRATTEEAEERAIALAMMDGYRKGSSMLILSDSQQACRNFLKGRIGARTAKLINKVTPKSAGVTHEIAWIPAHAGVTGNQAADDRARAHTFRAGLTQPGKTVIVNPSYSELLDHYKACRFQFPEPADRFDRIDAALWRRLQAGNFPNKVLARHVDPDRYEDDSCPWCGSRATLYHSTWECTNNDELPKLQDEEKGQAGWERLLRSRDPGEQLRLLERAKLAGQLLGILE